MVERIKLSLETKLLVGYAAALIAVIAIGFFTFRSAGRLKEVNHLITHTHEVIQSLNHALSLTVDIETGGRGFLLSGDTRQLQPYDSGKANIDIELGKLQQLIADNPIQLQHSYTFARLIHEKIELVSTFIEKAKQGATLAELLSKPTAAGRIVMDSIRIIANTMEQTETTLLAQRQQQEELRSDSQRQIMIFGSLLVCLIIVCAGISAYNDIKLRRKMEHDLHQSLAFLDSVVDNIPNMVFVKDAKHLQFIRFNKAGEVLLGVPKEELIGKSDYDFFSRERADFFVEHDRRVLAYGGLLDIPEETIETKHKGTRILHTQKIPIHDQAGNPQYLLGISEDITEQKFAESRINRFFELSVDLLCIANYSGYFIKLNPSWEKILGFTTKEMMEIKFLEFVHPDDRDATLAEMANLTKGQKTISFENRYRCKDGSYRHFVWNASPSVEDGTIYAVAHDITERKRTEIQIFRMNEELSHQAASLASANKELEAFSYSISHDLRTPLRSIAGFSQALVEDYGKLLDENGKDYLNRVQGGAQRMGQLIDDILQLSRVTRSKMVKQDTDLSALAKSIIGELQTQQPNRNVTVLIADNLTAFGDSRLLRSALDNLLGNAWKYTSKQETATIEFGTATQKGESVFFIRDNGVGFDMAYADKLFRVFERLHSVEEFEGTGIGLATVQRIINRHGGSIWAESAVNEGTTFYFTFAPIGREGKNHDQEKHTAGRGQSRRRAADFARA